MGDQDTARTIIFDLVQLEKLGADLEKRFRLNPATQVLDVLGEIDAEDHMLYLPQLTKLREDLVKRHESGQLDPLGDTDDTGQTMDAGESLHRSLMATAVHDGTAPLSLPGSSDLSKTGFVASSSTSVKSEGKLERIDQFRILRELGAGAFGVVYLAEDESLQRKVAIKVPKVSDPGKAASYINEARKAAAIDCKGIVPIYHVGTKENGVPFVVQKLIDGPSLRFLLSRYGSLPPAHAVTLMRDVAVALASAHRQGIYHRDLKPDNVLIDGNGVPWIADFGLAISESEQAQRKGEIAGTLIYMSPEQIQGRADWLDGRSDIWALGIMLYELLLGKPPFVGKNRQSLMEQICHREPRPLQQSSASLTPLNDVFIKCCAKNASDRYASVEELSEALSLLIENGLPTQTIDGSELRFEQPISQYPSGDAFATKGRTAIGAGSTQIGSRGSSVGPNSVSPSVQGVASLAEGPSIVATPLSQTTQSPPKAEPWTRIVMIAVGLAAVSLLGIQQWNSRRIAGGSPIEQSVQTTDPKSDPDTSTTIKPEQSTTTPDPVTTPITTNPQTVTPEPDKSGSLLTLDKANGTSALPWIVAPDGSGSHRSISDAIMASKANAHIHVKPGTYEEALKINKAVTLVSLGEPNECVIFNTQSSPLEILGDLGPSRMVGFSIRGDGRQTKKEFNAIELASGELRLENCTVRTSTFNCIKVRPGASLSANKCTFQESSFFAISAKGHLDVDISDCDFLESGIELVEGNGSISRCRFNGVQGICVETSQDNPTTISDCTFTSCFKHGILVFTSGNAIVKECNFDSCKIGVQVSNGQATVSRCDLRKCTTGLNLLGGKLTINEDTQISEGLFGITVDGGALDVLKSSIATVGQSGIAVLAAGEVSLSDSTLTKCGTNGILMDGGSLRIKGGSIQGCQETGLYVGTDFTKGELVETKFADNFGAAIIQESGLIEATDVTIDKSQVGLLVRAGLESPTASKITRVAFNEIDEVFVDLDGPAKLTVSQCDFGDTPVEKRYRTLGGAEVLVEQ